ncbi:hypothetical protein [Sphingomonas sp. 3-13AW]|uniref:hypothetical protein n=1 Tax=Sphingomonas sp. 3-13AW TaxID=3050450 RepID=UPI003BB4F69D
MNTKIIATLIAAALGMSLSAPAMAQRTMAQVASDLGSKPLSKRTEPVGRGAANIDARKDPWKVVTPADMVAATKVKRQYNTVAYLDYNADGLIDKAYIARNSRQGAVIVDLGGGKGTVVAYKVDEPLIYGQQIFPAGKRRIMLDFPESHVAILTQETGKPTVSYYGD